MKTFKEFLNENSTFATITLLNKTKEYDELTSYLDDNDIAWDVSDKRGKEVDIDAYLTKKQARDLEKKFKTKTISIVIN